MAGFARATICLLCPMINDSPGRRVSSPLPAILQVASTLYMQSGNRESMRRGGASPLCDPCSKLPLGSSGISPVKSTPRCHGKMEAFGMFRFSSGRLTRGRRMRSRKLQIRPMVPWLTILRLKYKELDPRVRGTVTRRESQRKSLRVGGGLTSTYICQ